MESSNRRIWPLSVWSSNYSIMPSPKGERRCRAVPPIQHGRRAQPSPRGASRVRLMRSSSRALDRSELLQVSALPRTVPSGQQVAMRRLAFQRERSAVWARADALQSKTKRLVMTRSGHLPSDIRDGRLRCSVAILVLLSKGFPPWQITFKSRSRLPRVGG